MVMPNFAAVCKSIYTNLDIRWAHNFKCVCNKE